MAARRESMNKQDKGIGRRKFLQGAGAAGAALLTTSWLSGCGEDDLDGTPAPRPGRELRTLHFDLSEHDPTETYFLRAIRSPSNRQELKPHTDATRQRFARQNPLVGLIAAERLTHYLEHVDLPSKAPQHIMVMSQPRNGSRVPGLVWSHIHVPRASLRKHGEFLLATGALARLHTRHAKLKSFGVGTEFATDPSVLEYTTDILTPLAAAESIIFQDPSVMNLDPDLAAIATCIIETSPLLNDLAVTISSQGPATEANTAIGKGWALLTPSFDQDGNPVLDSNGDQFLEYAYTDLTKDSAGQVSPSIIQEIFDDPNFADQNWHADTGITSVSDTPSAALLGSGDGSSDVQVELSHPKGSTVHGVNFDGLSVSGRNITVKARNRYIRYVCAYVQYADANGDALGDSSFVADLPTNNTIFGIPLMGDLVQDISMPVSLPDTASQAKLIFGSLGMGGQAFDPEAFNASIFTCVFNLGIPVILLGVGLGVESSSTITSILEDEDVKIALYAFGAFQYASFQAAKYTYTRDAQSLIATISDKVVSLIWSNSALRKKIEEIMVEEELEDAIPFVGWALQALSVAGTLATLAETTGEVLSSPAIFNNTISLTMTTTVTIYPDPTGLEDPSKAKFPDVASYYIVTLNYDGKVSRTRKGYTPTTLSDPIVETFAGVPSGGTVTVDVAFYSQNNWLAATGGVPATSNLPATASHFEVTITEILVPLDSTTQYLFKESLQYGGASAGHYWKAGAVPTETIASLNCNAGTTLCEVNGLTFAQQSQMVGYAFRAGNQGVPVCGGGTQPGAQLATFQNISVLERPQDALKFASCGYSSKALIAYDPKGHANGSGNNFVLAPNPSGEFHLRKIVLSTTQESVVLGSDSWGMIGQQLDAIAVHPSGYVVGIDGNLHKLLVATIPDQGLPDDQAPVAVLKMGYGTREGLLHTPRGLAITSDGTILILEHGTRRIQAVDLSGNSVLRFAGGTQSIVQLEATELGGTINYLDIAVEPLGYMYVLSYVGTGSSASNYHLDLFDPDGIYLGRTTGLAAARIVVDMWRTAYTLNYQTILGPGSRVEPSISAWIPSTPPGATP
jgi:hypothetical protein